MIVNGSEPLSSPSSRPKSPSRAPFSKHRVASETSTESEKDGASLALLDSRELFDSTEGLDDPLYASPSSSITLEEFELGKSPPEALVAQTELELNEEPQPASGYLHETVYPFGDIVNLLELASNPVVPDYPEDTVDDADQPDAENSDAGGSDRSFGDETQSSKAVSRTKQSLSGTQSGGIATVRSGDLSEVSGTNGKLSSDKVTATVLPLGVFYGDCYY